MVEGIFAKEEAFSPDYFPAELLHREKEITEIVEAIKPLLENRQPENLFIHGDSGTGKTACVKHVLKKLEEHSSKVKAVYINCWHDSTRMAVFSLIANALEEMMPRRGLARDEVYDRVLEIMEKEGIRVLLVLDELDGLFHHNEEKLLYDLGRAGKGKPFFGVISVSNNHTLLANKDMRIRSSIRLADLEFKQYNKAQIADILAERAKIGLMPGTWDKQIIDDCAAKAMARESNVRIGLEILWRAAKRAENADRKKITFEDVKIAEQKSTYDAPVDKLEYSFEFRSASLSEEQRLSLEILKTGAMSSTQFYNAFHKKLTRTKRQIRNYLKELEVKNLVTIEVVKGSNPLLNTKRIRLNLGGASK